MTRRGFTLVEIIAVMLIMSLAAVVVMPVVSVLLSRIDDSQARRSAAATVHTAIDQLTRTVREWPSESGDLSGIIAYRSGSELIGLAMTGAGGFRLDSGTLRLIDAVGDEGVLCESVDSFQVRVIGRGTDDPLLTDEALVAGVTVQLQIESAGVRADAVVFVRAAGGVG
ncbi:MAG: prepilin-type N-terminal cleavage/methylation domain-containing protein [Phycisphaerales bacterium]|jgi:prepilin-type N-terminal cleavage/methylation domain-containing protein